MGKRRRKVAAGRPKLTLARILGGADAHRARMATEKLDALPGGRIPDPDGFVLAGGGQVLAIRTEGHGVNRAAVAEDKDLVAATHLPHVDDAVGAGTDPEGQLDRDASAEAQGSRPGSPCA